MFKLRMFGSLGHSTTLYNLELKHETKHLGIIIDIKLTRSPHLDEMCKKIRLRHICYLENKASMWSRYSQSHLLYPFKPHLRYGIALGRNIFHQSRENPGSAEKIGASLAYSIKIAIKNLFNNWKSLQQSHSTFMK